MERQTARSPALAALGLLLASACNADPRIVATFRQGSDANGFASTQEGAYYYYNPPTVAGGHVFIGTSRKAFEEPQPDNFFFKLDGNLRKVWEVALGNDEVRGGAAVGADGRIYFVVEKGREAAFLYCLDPGGGLLWHRPLNPVTGWIDGMINPAIAADGTIYVGGEKLHAFAPDGSLRWTFPAGTGLLAVANAPIIDPVGNLYFAASARIYSVAPDGTQRWRYPDVGEWVEALGSPALSFDHSRVYVPLGRTLHCLDAASGAAHWSVWLPGGLIRATPAVDDHGNAYVGTKENGETPVFHAVSSAGRILWSNPIGADLYSSPALGDDRTVYVGSERTDEGRFHALDMATGARKWSVKLGADVTWSSPALVDGGRIYVGAMDGTVYAIRSDARGLLPNAGSARFHGGNDGTGRHE